MTCLLSKYPVKYVKKILQKFRMHGNAENLPLAAPYERMAIKKQPS